MSTRPVRPVFRLIACAAIVLVVLGARPVGAAPDDADRVAELIQRGVMERNRGDHERAAELFAKADEAAGGRSLLAVAGLCQEYHALGRWDESIAAAERWIELAETPDVRAGGQHYLGVALYQRAITGRLGAAQTASFRRAAEALRSAAGGVTTNRHLTLLSLADTLVHLGDHEEALEVLDEYADAVPAGLPDPLAADLRCWSERAVSRRDEPVQGQEVPVAASADQVTAPVKLHAPAPQYTDRARKLGVEGAVIVQTIVDRSGRVDCVRVLRGLEPTLDRNAMNTVKTWRFEPARLDGTPVEVYYNLTLNFSLHKRRR